MRLTQEQLLDIVKLKRGLLPALNDASCERFDALNIDRQLAIELRQRYLELLSRGDDDMVQWTDISSRLQFQTLDYNISVARLPVDVVRIKHVSVATSLFDVEVHTLSADDSKLVILNRKMRHIKKGECGGGFTTRAWICGDKLYVHHGDVPAVTPDKVMAVVDPGDEYYDMDERALSLFS